MASDTVHLTPKEVVDDIRGGFVDQNGNLIKSGAVQIAHDALEGYAHDLNAEVAHFIEEMLQNADDANYRSLKPAVTITDHGTHLLFSTNETGMTEANVRAICTIRRGTKTDSPDNIGEKGIGFKTTFKAANTVWIRSAGYTFRLDRTRPLGMAIPIWEDFPANMRHLIETEKTQFLLEYRDHTRAEDVRKALPQFNSRTLLFLRQLREIKIVLNSNNKRTITREDSEMHGGTCTTLTTNNNGRVNSSRFLIQRQRTTCTPPSEDRKRQGVTTSEVTIAMPLAEEKTLQPQYAYNFLPIRITNFRFLINADFKLLQNRADLDGDPENMKWNSDLMKGLAECFLAAIKRMNSFAAVRLMWQRLLPLNAVHDSFAPLRRNIEAMVRSHQLLFSTAGSLAKGDQLLRVPKQFRTTDNKLFFQPYGTGRAVLSTNYDVCSVQQLRFLGVNEMDRLAFLRSFQAFVDMDSGKVFQASPNEWHADIARLLVSYTSRELANIDIIPLTDGSWISSSHDVFFSRAERQSEFNIPFSAGSIGGIFFVAESACTDASWRRLMTHLGVEPLDKSRVSAKIRAVHDQSTPPTKDVQLLLAHAKFLFECGDYAVRKLWVQNSAGQIVPSNQTYVDDKTDKYPVSTLLGQKFQGHLLHSLYLSWVEEHQTTSWRQFIQNKLQVRTKPKLVVWNGRQEAASLELKHMAKTLSTQAFLSVLVENWSQISNLVRKPDSLGIRLADKSGFRLTDVSVMTQKHGSQALKDTVLPIGSLTGLNLPDLKFLKVESTVAEGWRMLEALGVLCTDDTVPIQMMKLEEVKRKSLPFVYVLAIYKKLQTLYIASKQTKTSIVDFFKSDARIFDPSTNTWRNSTECLWSSDYAFLPQAILSKHYSECERLFLEALEIPMATFDTVLSTIPKIAAPMQANIPKIVEILKKLAKETRDSSVNARKLTQSVCMKHAMVPLKYSGEIIFVALDSIRDYLLNDRESYENVFDEVCYQVVCSPSEARIMSNLFSLQGSLGQHVKKEHRLSACVREDAICSGKIRPDNERTEWLIEKFPFLKALTLAAKQNDDSTTSKLKRFEKLTIHSADGIEIKPYYETSQGKKIYGRSRPGTVSIDPVQPFSDQCKIYVDAKLHGVKGQASFFGEIDSQLAQYLEITTSTHKTLLKEIITADSDAKCLELLRPKGIVVTKTMLDQRPSYKSTEIRSQDTNDDEKIVRLSDDLDSLTTSLAASILTDTINNDANLAHGAETHASARVTRSDAAALSSYTTLSPTDNNEIEKDRHTGIQGELFVYKTLKKALGSDFGEINWTSELRHLADPTMSKWHRPDKRDYADFTITSRNEKFLAWLSQYITEKELEEITTHVNKYHIEVKTTNGRVNEPFHLSNFQWKHTQMLDDMDDEVYLIFRVFRLASGPQIQIVVNPFEQCYFGKLAIQGVDGLVCQIIE